MKLGIENIQLRWRCESCEGSHYVGSVVELNECGTPQCGGCDESMELLDEVDVIQEGEGLPLEIAEQGSAADFVLKPDATAWIKTENVTLNLLFDSKRHETVIHVYENGEQAEATHHYVVEGVNKNARPN